MGSSKPYLLSGPDHQALARRQATLIRMKAHLVRYPNALGSDQAAIAMLVGNGFTTIDAAILAGEARMLAYQEIVAREMSKP